jgi:hypothetical protein
MNIIEKKDLLFLREISSRDYQNNSMATNSTEEERNVLKDIKLKLKSIATYYKKTYDEMYGPFEANVSSGNPIAIGQTKLNRIWSGISKGAENKQYSAQISFVLNIEKLCLDVGFYFGRASAHMLDNETKIKFESQLNSLGRVLSSEIKTDNKLNNIYNSLFDYGFHASVYDKIETPITWIDLIEKNPKNSQITYSIPLDDNGIIEQSTIDLYVSMIIPLMNPIPIFIENKPVHKKKKYAPLTAQQRAKQAERRTLIGEEGELFALAYEENRLLSLGIHSENYPLHKAQESTDYGYDILSCDKDGNEIYIEVKTTTRLQQDLESAKFYMSLGEYEFYKKNKANFKLYRIYDIEGDPELIIIDMEELVFSVHSYIASSNSACSR